MLTAVLGFKPPVEDGGVIMPKPVPHIEITEPLAAGLEGLLIVPSSLTMPVSRERPGRRRKIPGARRPNA
jgi:hypothetical protein